jgi:hypothetical protein
VREDSREEPTLPRFALVRAAEEVERHALAPGLDAGAALCGAASPETGWTDVGETTRLYLIDCHACRESAAALLSTLGEQAGASREAESG